MSGPKTFSRTFVITMLLRVALAVVFAIVAFVLIGTAPAVWMAAVLFTLCGYFIGTTLNDIFR